MLQSNEPEFGHAAPRYHQELAILPEQRRDALLATQQVVEKYDEEGS